MNGNIHKFSNSQIFKLKEMNNIVVYCEIEEGKVADVSLELITKGRKLAQDLKCKLEALAIGYKLDSIGSQVFPYGVDTLYVVDDKRLEHYQTLPHTSICVKLFQEQKPQICLMGASTTGRDLGPRVSSALKSGLTADCTNLEIGPHTETKTGKEYKDLLYQIRPAFGGNIIATIVNPDCRPQMATVREGVMKKEVVNANHKGEVVKLEADKYVSASDFAISIVERHMEKSKVNIKNSSIIVSGGYGVGSKENFALLYELATVIGAEVGASRAAVDAGYAEHERQIGQTGVTVRPKLYIACGISGQIQHIAGMQESSMIISVNNDPSAPINKIADYVITGNIEDVLPRMIKYYKQNSK
jgi:electron transfer flavoprotein alpha subunit